MNRPAPISVFSDQRRTKSTTWSRTSCGTQVAVRVPQDFFLKRCAPPSTRPGPRPWSAPSSPRTQSASVSPPPGGEDAPSFGRQPPRSRRILFASGRTPSVAGPVLHTDRKPPPCLKDGVVARPPSPQQCSACALFSYVRSAILTDECFLHFQLRRDTSCSIWQNYALEHCDVPSERIVVQSRDQVKIQLKMRIAKFVRGSPSLRGGHLPCLRGI